MPTGGNTKAQSTLPAPARLPLPADTMSITNGQTLVANTQTQSLWKKAAVSTQLHGHAVAGTGPLPRSSQEGLQKMQPSALRAGSFICIPKESSKHRGRHAAR